MQRKYTKHRTLSTGITQSQPLPPSTPILPRTINQSQLINRRLFITNKSTIISQNQSSSMRMMTQMTKSNRSRQLYRGGKLQVGQYNYKMLEDQIQQTEQLFKRIRKLRQDEGVLCIDDLEEEQSGNLRDIPYNPQLYTMNEEICCIKKQIQEKMDIIFKIAKFFPKLRTTIETLLDHFTKENLRQSNRKGKIAAMKAQRRLIVASQSQMKRLGKI